VWLKWKQSRAPNLINANRSNIVLIEISESAKTKRAARCNFDRPLCTAAAYPPVHQENNPASEPADQITSKPATLTNLETVSIEPQNPRGDQDSDFEADSNLVLAGNSSVVVATSFFVDGPIGWYCISAATIGEASAIKTIHELRPGSNNGSRTSKELLEEAENMQKNHQERCVAPLRDLCWVVGLPNAFRLFLRALYIWNLCTFYREDMRRGEPLGTSP